MISSMRSSSSSFFSLSSFFLIFFLLLISSFSSSSSSISPSPQQPTCTNYLFADEKRVFKFCNDLPVLNSFLHWNYNPSTRRVDIAYRHTDVVATSTWVAWAINPTSTGMIGAQAFVAFQGPNGTIRAYTSPLTSYRTKLEEAPLSFPVHDISAVTTSSNTEIIIFATFELPNNNNSTIVNQLWQDGPLINGNTPGMHRTSGANVRSFGTLDFLSGHISKPTKRADIPRLKFKNAHGVVNAVSWGTLMPLGAIIARHMKRVQLGGRPALWFYLHIFCQLSGYVGGVGGWVTGLILGNKSSGIQYDAHRNIGIVLFALATLQVFALGLRPKPDHKYRFYWNIYHHMTGYTVIILSVVNVFKGIEILDPEKKWKKIYTGVIASLGVIAVVLEVISWSVVLKRKRDSSSNSTTTDEIKTTEQAGVVDQQNLQLDADNDHLSGPQSMV